MINEMNECMEKVMIGKIKEWLGDEEYVYDIYDYEIEFKKKIQKAGILSEVKKRERYEKPSVKRKRKSEAARKRKV